MAVAVVAVRAVELVLLAKETLVELVETGAEAEAVAVPELLVVLLPDPMAVLGELESLIQSLEVLYTTPAEAEAVETEEVTELGVTAAEVLGQLLPMLSMEPEVAVLVSPQVQTLEALEAMV